MKSVHIFIDEFGTPALNVGKEGVIPYFAYAAIVIEESELENARAVHQQVVKKYFNGTHIKSSNIHNDEKGHIKRLNIINDFSAIKHYVVALLVDKAKIESEGLGYKKSFIKFFNRIISEHFKGLYEEIHIHFDKTGRRITFEYSLVHGVNDTEEDAEELIGILKTRNCHLNLIPVNPIKERNFEKPSRKSAENFKNKLEKSGINVTIRREMGSDIDGACGQLRRRFVETK